MERVLNSVIPSLVEDGIFGDVQYVDLKTQDDTEIGAQWASTLAFVQLVVRKSSGEEDVISLVVKVPVESFEPYRQFHNELVMYQELIPALGFDSRWYPKLYYGKVEEENVMENTLVFENMTFKNYRNTEQSPFLDFEHISLSMKKIGKFHSLSYVLKNKNHKKFLELTKKLKNRIPDDSGRAFERGNFAGIERGVKAFQRAHGADQVLDDFLAAMKYTLVVAEVLVLPEEPFGVVCHGDFCNNNIMYQYHEDGSPSDCIFIDFQQSQYGSPAKDLAFYLYMHTTADTREAFWDQYLKIYYESVKEDISNDVNVPSFEEFHEHFASRAVFGYLICAFFLPVMMDRSIELPENLATEESVEFYQTVGGDEAEQKLCDIVSHLYHRKYLHAFLKYAKNKKLVP